MTKFKVEKKSGKEISIKLNSTKFNGKLVWRDEKIPVTDMDIFFVDPDKVDKANFKTDVDGKFSSENKFPENITIEFHKWKVNKDRTLYAKLVFVDGTAATSVEIALRELGNKIEKASDEKGIVRIDSLSDIYYNVILTDRWLQIPTIKTASITEKTKPAVIILGQPVIIETNTVNYQGEIPPDYYEN